MVVYNPKSSKASEFINHEEILETIDYGRKNAHNRDLIIDILNKAKRPRVLATERLSFSYLVRKMI